MRFDPDNTQFFFNTEMELTSEGYQELWSKYRDHAYSAIADPFTAVKTHAEFQKERGVSQSKFKNTVAVIAVLSFFALIICLVAKQGKIAGFIAAGLMLLIGFAMLIYPSINNTNINITAPAMQRLQGLVLVLSGSYVIYLILTTKVYATSAFIGRLSILAFAVIALILLFAGISQFIAPRSVYTEEVNATCIGYARYIDSDGNRSHSTMTSPVFEYNYEGERLVSTYDTFTAGRHGKIPVGSNTIIRISPDHPSHVLGIYRSIGVIFLIAAILCFAVAGFLYYLFFGIHLLDYTDAAAEPAAAEATSESLSEDISRIITDDTVNSFFGEDWYIETSTILEVTDVEGGDTDYILIELKGDFDEVYFVKEPDLDFEAGQEVYVIYEMVEENGELIKHPLNLNSTEGTAYVGEHTAYTE